MIVCYFLYGSVKMISDNSLKVGSCPNNDKSVQFSFLSFSV